MRSPAVPAITALAVSFLMLACHDLAPPDVGRSTAGATGHPDPPITSRVAGIYNIRDFGAKGDGRTDDTGAIQSAIDKMVHDGDNGSGSGLWKYAEGLTLLIPPSSVAYRLTKPLQIPSTIVNIKIYGGGRLRSTSPSTGHLVFISNSDTFPTNNHRVIRIADIDFEWLLASGGRSAGNAITFRSANRHGIAGPAVIERCTFKNGFRSITNQADSDTGYYSQLTVRDCQSRDMGGAFVNIYSQGASTSLVIERNLIQHALVDKEYSIRLRRTLDVHIGWNTFKSTGPRAPSQRVYIYDAHNVALQANRFEGGLIGDGKGLITIEGGSTQGTVRDLVVANTTVANGHTAHILRTGHAGYYFVGGRINVSGNDCKSGARLVMHKALYAKPRGLLWSAVASYTSPKGNASCWNNNLD